MQKIPCTDFHVLLQYYSDQIEVRYFSRWRDQIVFDQTFTLHWSDPELFSQLLHRLNDWRGGATQELPARIWTKKALKDFSNE